MAYRAYELKSNIDLHLERGALILFTKDHAHEGFVPPNLKFLIKKDNESTRH